MAKIVNNRNFSRKENKRKMGIPEKNRKIGNVDGLNFEFFLYFTVYTIRTSGVVLKASMLSAV